MTFPDHEHLEPGAMHAENGVPYVWTGDMWIRMNVHREPDGIVIDLIWEGQWQPTPTPTWLVAALWICLITQTTVLASDLFRADWSWVALRSAIIAVLLFALRPWLAAGAHHREHRQWTDDESAAWHLAKWTREIDLETSRQEAQ